MVGPRLTTKIAPRRLLHRWVAGYQDTGVKVKTTATPSEGCAGVTIRKAFASRGARTRQVLPWSFPYLFTKMLPGPCLDGRARRFFPKSSPLSASVPLDPGLHGAECISQEDWTIETFVRCLCNQVPASGVEVHCEMGCKVVSFTSTSWPELSGPARTLVPSRTPPSPWP